MTEHTAAPPIVWSIAGTDSGGGAGLAADQRALDACGAHPCTVVAAVTAQNSQAVTHIEPVPVEVLDAQLAALAADMPPAAIKTGLLGSAEAIACVARWVDRLRARQPDLPLVVDPVLRASTGAAFADEAVLQAYVRQLLPRASLITPNEAEARRLLTAAGLPAQGDMPALARQLQGLGAQAVAITGGDSALAPGWALDWLHTPEACGWLALPRMAGTHNHGSGCTFASSAAAALARGFVSADALVLAKMATAHALAHGHAAGQGAGPVCARAGFACTPERMPLMSHGESHAFDSYSLDSWRSLTDGRQSAFEQTFPSATLYAIVDDAARVRQAVQAGVRLVQLRMKTPDRPDAAWHSCLRQAMADAWAACRAVGATLVVNDHWQMALELAAEQAGDQAANAQGLALHLGQEDLLALGDEGRRALMASGLPLGISSHSLWELARARSLAPWYVACGPVWPTLTKAMPWHPQGLDNLAWWVRMAGTPVVAIGGILEHAQARQAAQTGAAAVCVVRGLGQDMAASVPAWQAAITAGAQEAGQGTEKSACACPEWPHPSLSAQTAQPKLM